MKKILFTISLLSLILFLSCKEKNPIVLNINNLEIRQKQFKLIFNNGKNEYEKKHNRKFTEEVFNEWIESYIGNELLLQNALRNNYDKNPEVLLTIEELDKTILSKFNGKYIQKELLKNVSVTKKEVVEYREIFQNNYSFECITIGDKESLEKLILNPLTTSNEYKHFQQKAILEGLKIDTIEYRWGSGELALSKENMQQILNNNSYGPFLSYNNPYKKEYIVVRLLKKEPLDVVLRDKIEDSQLENVILSFKKNILFHEYLYTTYTESKYSINDSIVSYFYNSFSYINETAYIDTNSIKSILDEQILEYVIQGNQKSITVREYINHRHKKSNFWRYSSKKDFEEFIQDFVSCDYIYNMAKENNYFENPDIKEKRTNVNNKIIIDYFIQDSIESTIIVTDSEIKTKYVTDSFHYSYPEKVNYNELYFTSYDDALNFLEKINNSPSYPLMDSVENSGFVLKKTNLSVNSDTLFNTKSHNYLLKLLKSDHTEIIQKENFFIVAFKDKEKGIKTIPLQSVEKDIYTKLFNSKKAAKLHSYIDEIKKKSFIQNNISLVDYFN